MSSLPAFRGLKYSWMFAVLMCWRMFGFMWPMILKKPKEDCAFNHPFDLRYHINVGKVDWESCVKVLDSTEKRKHLKTGWNSR